MSSTISDHLNLWWLRALALIILLRAESFGLNIDGFLLLSFKYSILQDPFGVLEDWNGYDPTPCSWNGVTCGVPGSTDANFRVTGLSLPDSGLLGPIPATLGMIEHLRNLDLSNNSINGSLPFSLFNAPELETLDFSSNLISGELPKLVGRLISLRLLNLSDNSLYGCLPQNFAALQNLTVVSLKNNYFIGPIPGGFDSVRVLDLSSNLINGSLPLDFGGGKLSYMNVSFNRISGEIPPEFGQSIPVNATIDLSFNNLTGPVPEINVFLNQDQKLYSGNSELCGKPLKNLCPIPSSAATLPSAVIQGSPPAIAAIPKTIGSEPAPASTGETASNKRNQSNRAGLRPGTILGIVAGDITGVGVLVVVFLYVYHKKKRRTAATMKKEPQSAGDFDWASSSESPSEERSWLRGLTCLKKHRHAGREESPGSSSDTEDADTGHEPTNPPTREQKNGALVTVDGEKELELETLLKASAYILGASGSSIMYKAVLEDGTTLAVRRVGENGVERFRDFQNQVRVIAKLVHPNLVRIRGFYWGTDEKLIIYDFVPNGSLANARYKKAGASPCHVPWETRLRIARGVARGLCYIHEKKHVHGNLKPSNILLGPNMEPKISDFGLQRLVAGESNSSRPGGGPGGSARNFGSKRSTASRDSFQDYASGPTPSPSPSVVGVSPYHAPESLRSLKPSPKWDVFSFGVVLLELLTGKVVASDEAGPALAAGALSTSSDEERERVVRMADVAVRGEVEGKEEAFLGLLRLGYGCISAVPQKRPTMREALQALEKFPSDSYSSAVLLG